MRITMKTQGLEKAAANINKYTADKLDGIKRVIAESTVSIQSDAVSLAPEDTGNLKNSINFNITNKGLTGEVYAGAEYAPDVEFGTDPHKIVAKNGKALAFKKDGKTVFAKSVNHPGTRAQPFLFPAWEAEMPKFESAIRKEMNTK